MKNQKRQEQKQQKQKVSLLYRAAMFLYKQACIRNLPLFNSRQVERDLLQLYPGENVQYLRTEYYVKKLSTMLTVLLLGGIFGITAKISADGKVLLKDDGSIPRGSYLEGRQEIQVIAGMEEGSLEIQIGLEPRRLSWEETEELADSFLEQLPVLILGKNDSLLQVSHDLELLEEYEGYPFQVEWKSSRPDILGSSGSVREVREAQQLLLTVSFKYEEYEREEILEVTIVSPLRTTEELIYRDLEEYLISSEENSRGEEMWILPEQWEGRDIVWSQKVEDNSLLLCAAALAVAVLVYWMSDKDLHQQLEKRHQSLRREYPDLVHRLALFVGAGMTVRGAIGKISVDYEKKRESTGRRIPAYEEMLRTCRELQSGTSEGAALEHFGRRTGQQEYIRLSTLLMQNVKRGNSTLLERLREEADKAGEEKLMESKRLGEEAGTKLLVPMVMMLAVVMVMIMVPAFSGL